MSVDAARRLGVPEEKWVYLHGHADMVEQGLLERDDFGASPAAVWPHERRSSGAESASTTSPRFDLYSCFPFPVFVMCDGTRDRRRRRARADAYRRAAVLRRAGKQLFAARDRRDGSRDAGQARAIRPRRRQRRHHEQVLGRDLLHPAGGMAEDRSAELNDEIVALPTVAVTEKADGPATVETYSVRYDWPVRPGSSSAGWTPRAPGSWRPRGRRSRRR